MISFDDALRERLFKGSRAKLTVAAGALAAALAMGSGGLLSAAFRSTVKSHFPEAAARWSNDGRASVVALYGTENMGDDLGYAARVRGAAKPGVQYDPYIGENRSARLMLSDLLMYKIMALAFHATGDVSRTWILLRILCGLLWFVLIYRLVERAVAAPPLAFFCAAFIVCFSYLTTLLFMSALEWSLNPARLIARNAWVLLSYGRTESLVRLPRPAFNYAALFLASLLLIRTAEKPSLRRAAASGLLGGLLAYMRVDSWTHYMAAGVLFAGLSWWRKRPWTWLAASMGLSALISLPWLAASFPPDPDLALRMGVDFGHFFYPRSLWYLLLFAIGARRFREPAPLFFTSIFGGAFLAQNVQLATGVALPSYSYAFFSNVVAVFWGACLLPERWRRRTALWMSAAALAILAAFFQTASYAAIHYPFQGLPSGYEKALEFLDKNTPQDSVVLALNPETNTLIPAFTGDRVSIPPGVVQWSDLPTVEIARRLLAVLRALGADEARFMRDCFSKDTPLESRDDVVRGDIERRHLRWTYFYFYYPLEKTLEFLAAARKTPAKELAVDYVWIGRFERTYAPDFPKRSPLRVKEEYRNADVTLYRVLK